MTEREIIDQLVKARKVLRLSQTEVAHRMHVPPSAVSTLERTVGRRSSITLDRLLRYASAMGVKLHVELQAAVNA